MAHTRKRVVFGILLATLISGCTSDDAPEPPSPTVSTVEFEQRLDEHLARFAALLQPEANVSTPVRSRERGCADGPSWAVMPRADFTVRAGDQTGQRFKDLQDWMGRNGFDGLHEGRTLYPGADWEVKGRHSDGTRTIKRRDKGAEEFTVTVTGPCTWPPARRGAPAPGKLAPLAEPSKLVSLIHTGPTVDRRVCTSPKIYVYNDGAPAFAGPGPHPMVLHELREDDAQFLHSVRLPLGLAPRDGQQAQLVVCVEVSIVGGASSKVTCHYRSRDIVVGGASEYTFDVVPSVYEFTVRDARTGVVVHAFSLNGNRDDESSCVYEFARHLPTLARGLDENAMKQALGPLYGSAR